MQENLNIEFQTFKNQINPDLLFQGLEIIISELHRDRNSADNLISELSNSYRYTLDNKNNDLVPLSHELDSLIPLLRIFQSKYPSSFNLAVKITDERKDLNLIPGSLKTLTEFAIAENIISKDLPLSITITEENGQLLFRYSLNERLQRKDSNAEKLEILKRAYRYYSDIGIVIKVEENSKTIRLPLLEVEEE